MYKKGKFVNSKIYFIYKILGFKFFLRQRWKQFIRLMTNTSVLPSILLAIFTADLSISFVSDEKLGVFWKENLILIHLFALLLSIIICIFGGRAFFRAQPPEVYAEYSIAGTTPSYSTKYIAYCIWKECLFISKNEYLFSFFDEVSFIKEDQDKLKRDLKKFKRNLDRFHHRFQEHYDNIQKINFMILGLAKSMNVPGHRVSDFLFQFSPDIFHQEIKKAIQKMYELYFVMSEKPISIKEDKFKKSTSEISNIFVATIKRKVIQKDIIYHEDLHDFIMSMSAGFGLSNAFGAYCMGLQRSMNPKEISETDSSIIFNRFVFMYHKRRIYSGFDLHALLYSFICNLYEREKSQGVEDVKNKYENFKKILNEISIKIDHKFSKPKLAILQKNVANLYELYEDFRYEERKVIVKRFSDELCNIVNEKMEKGHTLIVITQGYSSVVNYTLKEIAETVARQGSNITGTKLDESFRNKNIKIEYYILENPLKDKRREKVVSRYLRYKFKENPNIPEISYHTVSVKICDKEWLNRHIKSLNEKVFKIIVSGAEFIQEDLDKDKIKINRIINNEAIFNFLKKKINIQNREKEENHNRWEYEKNYKWFVLAESFKVFPTGASNYNTTYKKGITNDYLEDLHLYDWSPNRTILTGEDKKDDNVDFEDNVDNLDSANQ